MESWMDDWRREEANNQVRFREFNEWIRASNGRTGNHRPVHEYICECSDASCRDVIELSDEEYEEIRGFGSRFAIALNHEDPELDQVLVQHSGFTTIEKLPGEAARLAAASDPRRGSTAPWAG
jgi:hypothetical protein